MHPLGRSSVVLLAAAAILPLLMTASPEWPTLNGDEPHYVILANSLLQDGDLELTDDYAANRLDWLAAATITPHVKEGGRPGTYYSFHGAGLAWLIAPFLALDPAPPALLRLLGVVCSFLLGLGLLVAIRATAPDLPALPIAVIGQLTSPILFNVPHLFPDLPAAAASLWTWNLAIGRSDSKSCAAVAGTALALLPWLHFKFLLLWAVLLLFLIVRWYSARGARPIAIVVTLAAVGPITLCLWNWVSFGSPSPTAGAAYPAAIQGQSTPLLAYLADPAGALRTGIGLFLDQKDGLLAWAPHLLLAAAGAAWLWQRRRLETTGMVIVFASVWLPAALSQNTGLWSPPGRWLLAVAWVPVLLAGVGLTFPSPGRAVPRVRGALVAATVVTTALCIAHPSLIYVDRTDTRSPLLQSLGGPGLPIWNLFPVWTRYDVPAWPATLVFSGLISVAAVWLWRRGAHSGRSPTADTPSPNSAVDRPTAVLTLGLLAMTVSAVAAVAPIGGPLVTRAASYDRIQVHVSTRPAARAWPHPTTVWFGGRDEVTVWLSTERPVQWLEIELMAPIDQTGVVRIGESSVSYELPARGTRRIRLKPDAGRAWNGRYWQPMVVTSTRGIRGSDFFGGNGDDRLLGLNVRFDHLRLGPAGVRP